LGLATIAVGMAVTTGSLSADPLVYSTSGSANTSAGLSFTYDIGNDANSSGIAYEYVASGSDTGVQDFSFLLSLPSLPGGSLIDATLDLSVSDPSGSGSYTQNTGAVGFCFFSCDWNNPQIYFNEGQYAEITSVTDGTNTWNGAVTYQDLNLVGLGFGDDLLSGGDLTISGYREVYSDPSIASPGYNGYADVNINYSETGSEYATLSLDATPAATDVPEPGTISLMLVGLAGLWKRRRGQAAKGL
jgi:hypothetical protein